MNLGFFVTSWPGRIAALALAGVAAGGVIFVARAQQLAAKPELRTTTVTKGNVTQTVSVSGSVAAQGQAKLAFKTGGRISEIYVGVGQAVSAGQSLAKLDTADLETALATAQQNLANAQASYQLYLYFVQHGLDREAVRYERRAIDQGFTPPPRLDPRRG